jgi:hypothetical protein
MGLTATGSPWLLDGAGCPLAPESVLAELKEIDPRLGLQFHIALNAFMVTLRWPEDDPRRELIRRGELSPETDFEILCPVPADIKLDELRGWLAGQLRRVGQTRADVREMVEAEERRLAKLHADLETTRGAEALEVLLSAPEKNINVGKRRTRIK